MSTSHPWSHILNCIHYNVEHTKSVSATDIKNAKATWTGSKASQFEPRLLAYYPSLVACPQPLKERGLNIIPTKNGEYLLLKESIYEPLSYTFSDVQMIPKDTTSVLLGIGSSETSIIDNLRYSGVFERPEILGEPITHGSLLNGRHYTGEFTFQIGDTPIRVSSVQYEIDACFETQHKILILEGKSSPKEIDSFNIRQLYYPYRVLQSTVQGSKEFLCGFVHELKGIVHIWLYTFDVPECMDSIRQVGYYRYKLN